ncbi:MAG: hypothetical protein JXB35_06930 [Anaerolineae bacterium]|nr:hypothetical protein [Anaerolineae bacterium]
MGLAKCSSGAKSGEGKSTCEGPAVAWGCVKYLQIVLAFAVGLGIPACVGLVDSGEISYPTLVTLTLPPLVSPTPEFPLVVMSSGATPTVAPVPQLAESAAPPSLADFWEERAAFVVDVVDTGLPLGESDTIVMGNGEWWSYLHASDLSAGTRDQCGNPVSFPGCTVLYRSVDGGLTFTHDEPPVCLFACYQCPCESEVDHIDQQQYPRVADDGATLFLVYEYRGRVRMRRSPDGLQWGEVEKFTYSTIWKRWLRDCYPEESIGVHPFVPYDYECLAGGPPGIFIEDGMIYVFMGMGQNPGSMGCYYGSVEISAEAFVRCQHNPLFTGAEDYGPLDVKGTDANAFFDFRTISSAEVHKVEDRYYMFYEGVRGPGPGDFGDTQFGLGLARSVDSAVDGAWETYPGNPILVDLPGNVGLGHADLVVSEGRVYLYTSLDGRVRSRLKLIWK